MHSLSFACQFISSIYEIISVRTMPPPSVDARRPRRKIRPNEDRGAGHTMLPAALPRGCILRGGCSLRLRWQASRATFAGCREFRRRAPEIPLEQQTEQKLDPLTQDDVNLYLKVMRAAALRVKNPLPADTAALDGAKRIFASRASGRIPTHEDVMTLERANLVATSMDQIVAEEMKLDGRTYRGIARPSKPLCELKLGVASGNSGAPAAEHTLSLWKFA